MILNSNIKSRNKLNWEESWKKIGDAPKSGGQGEVFKVVNKVNKNSYGALKLMHESQIKSSKRRLRFEKEIKALEIIDNESVPKVLESNLESSIPYFISQWIDGDDLSKMDLTISESLQFTKELASIVHSCHEEGVVHRDIKPENIIARNNKPVLIDFGLCWTKDESENSSNKTPLGEELGNRFLRLPELTAGSREKHEKICDVSFLVGILFFLTTRKHPRVLKDSNNKMPHERLSNEESEVLNKSDYWKKIQRIFNVGFQQSSSLRYESCPELIEVIDQVLNINNNGVNKSNLAISKKMLIELVNTDELNEKLKSSQRFTSLNANLKNYVSGEVAGNGIYVSHNSRINDNFHEQNMFIKSNLFQNIQVILCHQIEIVDKKIQCTYRIKGRQIHAGSPNIYYVGYVSDFDSLEEAINNNRDKFLSKALDTLTEKISTEKNTSK